jgi:Ca2+/Na+ antiporter
MVKEIIENGDKIVRIAEDVKFGGTIPVIISLIAICVVVLFIWVKYSWSKEERDTLRKEREEEREVKRKEREEEREMRRKERIEEAKDKKEMLGTMREMADATKEIAESNRSLVDTNKKKDEVLHYQTIEFNSIRSRHVEEVKKLNETACDVSRNVEKVEDKLEKVEDKIKDKLDIVIGEIKEMKILITK